MALTYTKARIAAVLELPPEKPSYDGRPTVSRATKLRELKAYRVALQRWRKIGDLVEGASLRYREVVNGPARPGERHGTGTLHSPKGADAVIGRVTDCSVVHTAPNRAARRAAGGRRTRAIVERFMRARAAAEARENIAKGYRVHGRWHPYQGSIGALASGSIADLDDDGYVFQEAA